MVLIYWQTYIRHRSTHSVVLVMNCDLVMIDSPNDCPKIYTVSACDIDVSELMTAIGY